MLAPSSIGGGLGGGSPLVTGRGRTPRPPPQAVLDFYPLDKINDEFPEDVDARISSMVTCPSQVHVAWCQWVSHRCGRIRTPRHHLGVWERC